MKKLYRKSTVHPTPSAASNNLSSYLPAAILTLTAALSPADREVLAYFTSTIFSDSDSRTGQKFASGGGGGAKSGEDHPLCSKCSCFRCYTTYWAKWDSSPNRQLIDEIMDAYEVSLSKHSPMKDSLSKDGKKEKNRRDRRKGKSVKGNISLGLDESVKSIKSELSLAMEDSHFGESSPASEGGAETGGGSGGEEDDSLVEEDLEKGSVRRFVSFLGERIWGVWG